MSEVSNLIERLGPKLEHIAYMIACGAGNQAIAERFGMHPTRISIIRNAPAIRAHVEQIQREMRGAAMLEVTQRLAAEAAPTLERLVRLRDQETNLAVALGATNALFDRQVPKVTVSEGRTEHTIRFDGAFLRSATAVLAEAGEAIDVAIDAADPKAVRAPRGAMLAEVEELGD